MIRLASYNIRKAIGTDRLRRPDRIVAVLAEIDADVVALQEADRRLGDRTAALPPAMLAQAGWSLVDIATRRDSIGWHGNALLVRQGITVAGARRIDLPTIEPRGAVVGEIVVAGQVLRIVGMHLDLSGLRRRRQARAIMAALGGLPSLPTVVMGDTNEWRPHSGCLIDFAHGFRVAATGPSFHSRRPVARLDRIMVDHRLNIAACGTHRSVLASRASDHLPVWADVELAMPRETR